MTARIPAYDLIVVGAGPAGSTLAREVAATGARVLLLDRAPFPRDKPCGGGVTQRAALALGVDLSPVVERTVYGARFSFRRRYAFEYRFPQPLVYMTQRRCLDEYLARQAEEAGARFHDGDRVMAVEAQDGSLRVRSEGGVYMAAVVAGADGANGVVARSTGLNPRERAWLALEGNARRAPPAREWQDFVGLELGSLPGGYGWLFAKGDHVNLGVGGWFSSGGALRGQLEALCQHYGFRTAEMSDLRGHALPLRRPGTALVSGRALLVGDAAALVDPLSGEGIHSAFLSARLAARAIGRLLAGETGDLQGYQEAVDHQLMPDLVISRKLQRLYHQSPWPYVQFLGHSRWFWGKLCRLIRGESSYQALKGTIGPLAPLLDLLARLAKEGGLKDAGRGY